MTGRTLACVLIQLEGWLDKTRVEIVALDCSGCGTQQQFGYDSV